MWPYDTTDTLALVRQIAANVFGKTESQPEFLAKGSNNEAFLVHAEGGQYVIRVTGEWRERTTRRERWCYAQAKQLAIPGPEVRAVGKLEKLPYVVLSFIEGKSGVDDPQSMRMQWRTLGKYGRMINGIDVQTEAKTLYPDPVEDWQDQVKKALETLYHQPYGPTLGVGADLRDKIADSINDLCEKQLTMGLSHGDLDPRNIIVGEDGKLNLIDWCCSQVSLVPHVDLFNILQKSLPGGPNIDAYLAGYGMKRSEFIRLLPEVHVYGLVQRLARLNWSLKERPDLVEEDLKDFQSQLVMYIGRIT